MPPKRANTAPLSATLPASEMVLLLSKELANAEAEKRQLDEDRIRVIRMNAELRRKVEELSIPKSIDYPTQESERAAQEKAALLAARQRLWEEACGQPAIEAFLEQHLPREPESCWKCDALIEPSGLGAKRCVCGFCTVCGEDCRHK